MVRLHVHLAVLLTATLAAIVPLRRIEAQHAARFVVDPTLSLAWWQVNPHLEHLWATTCPEEPSWLPGVGRSGSTAWTLDGSDIALNNQFSTDDTVHIPLFPRHAIWTTCPPAIHGGLIAPDTISWNGAHGRIEVDAATLYSGGNARDAFARSAVLQVGKYPQIVMIIDSVVDVAHGGGDTVHAVAMGKLLLHGAQTPLSVSVVAAHDTGGVRVRGRWYITGKDLWNQYAISKVALGLGIGFGIWRELWLGIDLVMRVEPPGVQ
jgi:hypothetical protein